MVINFIISAALCYTITKLSVLIHELGHIFALSITKRKLKLQVSFITSIFTFGLYGITFSPVYFYLKRYKYKNDIQKLIKFNATMGLVFEFIFLFTILGICLFQFFYNLNYNYIIICCGIFSICLILITLISIICNISDIKHLKTPKKFTYKEFLPSLKGKRDYIIIPLILFFITSLITYFIFQEVNLIC